MASAAMVPTVIIGGEIPPARTPFKIQDPYTGRYVWNKDDNLHLRGNGDGEELLWELEYAAVPTRSAAAAAAVETGYLLRNVHSGKVMVDESAGDGRLSGGFGVKEIAIGEGTGGELESQVWTMRPLECDVRRGLGRLYCIQNRRNLAYIVNGLRARGKKQLRTRVTNEESKSQAWRFILMSEPRTVSSRSPDSTRFESPSTSSSASSTRPERISRPNSKRTRSDRYKDRGSTEQEESEYWKRMPPPIPIEDIDFDIDEHAGRKIQKQLPGRSNLTAGDSNFLQESIEGSWMSQPSWKRWISAVSDFDVSWVASNIGTRAALENGSCPAGGANVLLADSPWYSLAKLEETAP